MTDTFLWFLANIFLIQGLQKSFTPGEILDFIPRYYANWFSRSNFLMQLNKPLFFCAPCMSSIYGVFFWFTDYEFYLYPVWVICLTGANVIISKLSRY